MPTWQGMEFLERVLDALAAQETQYDLDLHVIDSGSTDGTWEYLNERTASFPFPLHLYRIASQEFDHGDTRNQLAARSRGDLLVFLTQDAIPSRPDWLECLARNFEDPRVGAVTCRNVPRPDARLLTRVFSESDPGYGEERIERTLPDPIRFAAMSGDERRLLYNFNDVASAVRRELWEYFPFPRTMMGEDILMARGLIHAGYNIVHDVEATVDHSHDYGPEKMQWRGYVDGKFNAEWLDRICVTRKEDVEELSARMIEGDRAILARWGYGGDELESLLEEALVLRTALARGLYEGGLSPLRYAASAIRETRQLRLLFVDPDDTLRELACGLGRRGHEVHLLTAETAPLSEMTTHWHHETHEAGDLWKVRIRGGSAELASSIAGWIAGRKIDVCHLSSSSAGASKRWCSQLIQSLHESGCAAVCDWRVAEWDGKVQERNLRDHVRADLRLTGDATARKRALEAFECDGERLDPQTFGYVEAPGREHAKSLEHAIADAEFRYRGLASRSVALGLERDTRIEFAGDEADCVRGECEAQGSGLLLLRPKALVEYRFRIPVRQRVRISVEQQALAAERDVNLQGRLWIVGMESLPLQAPERRTEDGPFTRDFELELAQGAHRLLLTTQAGCMLRLSKVLIESVVEEARASDAAPADLNQLVEELRVFPGPPVETALPVAIVIPHLQDRSQLSAVLHSIEAMDYPEAQVRVLIIDNSGVLELRDGEAAGLGERLRILPQEKNLGFAAACNLGASEARDAQALVFVNDDMVLEPSFLRELMGPLLRGECACSTARLLDSAGRNIDTSGTGTTFHGICVQPGFGEAPKAWQEVPRKTLFGCGGAMAIRAEVFREVGGFDAEYFAYYEDLDLGWRLWLSGYEIHYVPTAVARHHHSSTSKTMPPEQVRLIMVRNSLTTIVKNYDEENLKRILPAVLALASRRAFSKSNLAVEEFRIGETVPSKGLEQTTIAGMGAADWIAIDDLLSRWGHWMEKRREVQRRRRRTDAEIQRMFLQPLAIVEGDPAYAALQTSLARWFGLEDLFARR